MQKLDIGGVLSRAANTYKEQAGVLLPAALIVFAAVLVIGILLGLIGSQLGVAGVTLAALLVFAVALAAHVLYQGMVVQTVSDIQDGRRDASMGELFRSVVPVVPSLIAAGALFALAVFVPAAVIGFVLTKLIGAVAGLLLTSLLYLILAVVLFTLFCLVPAVIVVERPGVIDAFRRGRELVRGHEMQVFLIWVIIFVAVFVAALILGAILGAILPRAATSPVLQLIVNVALAPLFALVVSTIYFQLQPAAASGDAGPGAVGAAPTQTVPGGQPSAPAQPAPPSQAPPSQPPPGSPPPATPPPASPPPGSPPPT